MTLFLFPPRWLAHPAESSCRREIAGSDIIALHFALFLVDRIVSSSHQVNGYDVANIMMAIEWYILAHHISDTWTRSDMLMYGIFPIGEGYINYVSSYYYVVSITLKLLIAPY